MAAISITQRALIKIERAEMLIEDLEEQIEALREALEKSEYHCEKLLEELASVQQ